MSDLWHPELLHGATRVDAWARPTSTGAFTPWSEAEHPNRRAADRSGFRARHAGAPRQQPVAEPEIEIEPEPDIEAIQAEAFAAGFQQGRETTAMELMGERKAVADLIRAAKALQPEAAGPLAAVLAETVARLVRQVVGETVIDTETLHERALSIAEMVGAESGPARLRMHPDDIARLDGHDLPVALAPDHHLAHGAMVLETGEGWIEDGPEVRLAKLRAQLDAMGLPR
jgi:flagellar assembly protein FliH